MKVHISKERRGHGWLVFPGGRRTVDQHYAGWPFWHRTFAEICQRAREISQ